MLLPAWSKKQHSCTVGVKNEKCQCIQVSCLSNRRPQEQKKGAGRQGSVAGEQRPKKKNNLGQVETANVTRTCSVCAACNASMPTFVANLDICGDMSLALMTHLLIVPVRRFVLHNRTDSKIQPATQLKSSRRCVDSTRLNTSTSIIIVIFLLELSIRLMSLTFLPGTATIKQ